MNDQLPKEDALFQTTVTVEWGDCDAAGIVFYPNYFYWFDCAYQRLLRARGLGPRVILSRFGAITPIVSTDCSFRSPARHDDMLDFSVVARKHGERRFQMEYEVQRDGRVIAVGTEIRAWALLDGNSITGAPVDQQFFATISE